MVTEPDHSREDADRRRERKRWWMLLAGLTLDLVDLSTEGPLGALGGILGAGLVWWLSGTYGLGASRRMWVAIAAGLYCALPSTELIPVGTLLGAYLTLRAGRRKDRRPADDLGKRRDHDSK